MTPFEHTVALISIYHPLGVREGVFLHTPSLNSLPKKTYRAGKLQGPKFVDSECGEFVEVVFFGDIDYDRV